MKIEWLISGISPEWRDENFQNGGYVYDTYARKALGRQHELLVTYLARGRHPARFVRAFQFIRYVLRCRRLRFRGDVVIRDLYSTAFVPFDEKRRHAVMVHHLDDPFTSRPGLFSLLKRRILKRMRRADAVVAVSEYWKKLFEAEGCRAVTVIQNSFDLGMFSFKDTELRALREKLRLPEGKPLIYLGNANPKKGWLEAYQALKDIDAVFVATGRGRAETPVLTLFLSYSDYLKLLKLSTLTLTMSKFAEGWCRTAHESMLCGTPVVGSGLGGMRELLEDGGQVICENFQQLGAVVRSLLQDSSRLDQMSVRGQEFARRFSLDSFEKRWLEFVSSLGQTLPDHVEV